MENEYLKELREAVQLGTTTQRKFAAVIVAFLEAETSVPFEAMADLLGIKLDQLGTLFELAQKVLEGERV